MNRLTRPGPWKMSLALAIGFALASSIADAGGTLALTWDQASDCASITGWELLVAPITAANPTPAPTSAIVRASIANTGAPTCGLAMTTRVTLTTGTGPQRFWLRAVAGADRSAESNTVDLSLPLARPSNLHLSLP